MGFISHIRHAANPARVFRCCTSSFFSSDKTWPFRKLLTLLAVLAPVSFLASSASAQVSLVRVTSCGSGPYPATVCAIPSTASGHLIVVAWSSVFGTTPVISSVTDNAGNVYAEAGNARAIDSATVGMIDIWYAKNSNAGATAITITPNPSGNQGAAVVWEFANVDTVAPLDRTSVLNSQPATTTPSGASVTTAAPGVILSLLMPSSSLAGIHAGNAFTNDSNIYGVGWARLITSSAGTYAAQWDTGSGTYASSTVAFRAAGSGSTVSSCDLNTDGLVNVSDVQLGVNMSLGLAPCTANIYGAGVCNVIVVQRLVNAALGGPCVTGVTTTPHSVTLNWTASTSSNITGYNVYRGATAGGPYTKINPSLIASTSTSYTDTTVQGGTTYYYVATAVDNTGMESSYSNMATAVVPSP